MFNEDIETAISMWRDKNHIELLLKIEAYWEARDNSSYETFTRESLSFAVKEYLDTYGHTKEMN